MIIKAVSIDDEFASNEIIKRYCSKIEYIDLVATFTDENAALDFLSTHPVDLLFLDINMPEISGIEFVKLIPRQTLVVFISAYSQRTFESKDIEAFAYLTKIVSFESFFNVVQKAKGFFEQNQ